MRCAIMSEWGNCQFHHALPSFKTHFRGILIVGAMSNQPKFKISYEFYTVFSIDMIVIRNHTKFYRN